MPCHRVETLTWPELVERAGWAKRALENSNRRLFEGLRDFMKRNFPHEKIFIASYDYGQLIVRNGHFETPCQDPQCDSCGQLRQAIGASGERAGPSIPLAFVLKGCAEVFLRHPLEDNEPGGFAQEDMANNMFPLNVIETGSPFGVFETLDYRLRVGTEVPAWQVSAGIRSIYVLAPLDNEGLIEGLTRRGGPGGKSVQHWELVSRTLEGTGSRWQSTILVLPRIVIDGIGPSTSQMFHELMLETGWKQSSALRMSTTRDGAYLRKLRQALDSENLEVGQLYYYFTIRHCINMLHGQRPVLVPTHRFPDPGGPFEAFGERLAEELARCRFEYEPVILRPGFLSNDIPRGYYSIRIPSAPEIEASVHPRPRNSQKPPVYKNVLADIERIATTSKDNALRDIFTNSIGGFIQRPRKAKRPTDPAPWAVYSDELPAHDFGDGGRLRKVYWNSPFFVAGLRLTRPGAGTV